MDPGPTETSSTGLAPSGQGPAGPVSGTLPCATCRTPVDPLRAARVAMFHERFHYFCSSECRDRFDPQGPPPAPLAVPEQLIPRGLVAAQEGDTRDLHQRRQSAAALADIAGEDPDSPLIEPDLDSNDALGPPPEVIEPVDLSSLLLALGAISGALSAVLTLAGDGSIATLARMVLAVLGAGALVGRAATTSSGTLPAAELHPASLLVAPTVAAIVAVATRLMGHPEAGAFSTVAGVLVATTGAGIWLLTRASRPSDAAREQIAQQLTVQARRIVGEETAPATSEDLRPGEEIVLEAGDVVPVDATIVAGSGTVHPWLGSTLLEARHDGDTLVAGAQVVEGRLRAVVAWAGFDRAWMRLTSDPRRRADLVAPSARLGKLIAERGAPLAALIAAVSAFATSGSLIEVVLAAATAHAAIATAGVAQVGAVHYGRGLLAGLRRGIAFRSADAFERAGRVTSATFCARGTLLLGEPEVANIEAFGDTAPERVLALVAGAEAGATHPIAVAVQRAARDRELRPDGVRSPTVIPGLGVTAVASSGQALVVGSRALMLRERIGVAAAEGKLSELEALGRSVLLVALGGKLVGVLGLQDGLRTGARAAVQHILDAGIEPVLLSGDTRETCEALGRNLDIDHVRPEVLPADRGAEIRSLVESGATVAVLGRSPQDDSALSAANVAVALQAAGSSSGEWHVELAADDVRDAAFALRLAAQVRREARLGLAMAVTPGAAAALVMAIGLIPPLLAPMLALVGTLLALGRLRMLEEV